MERKSASLVQIKPVGIWFCIIYFCTKGFTEGCLREDALLC